MAMIRVTDEQASLLFGRIPNRPDKAKKRACRPKEELPENVLEAQIRQFLSVRRWVCIRQQVGTFVPFRVFAKSSEAPLENIHPVRIGRKGTADWIAVRPLLPAQPGRVEFFYWEAKGPGKTPKPFQRQWLEQQAACGFMTAWFDDYDGDWDTSFVPWYRARFGK